MKFGIYNTGEILDNNPKNKAKEGELRTKLAKLRLNPVCHSRGILFLPEQVLGGSVTTMDRNGRKREGILSAYLSCFFSYSEPYFIDEKNVRLLERLSLNGSNGVYDKNTSRLPIRGSHQGYDYGVPDPDNLVIRQQHSVSRWRKKATSQYFPSPVLVIGGTMLTIAYSGSHATAWNAHFAAFAERTLWCVSCIIIASGGLCGVLIVCAFAFLGLSGNRLKSSHHRWVIYEVYRPLVKILSCVGILLYSLALEYLL
jgi:hypothetical protein